MDSTYDIIIIGGGMVGASLAAALRATSLRIALVDATVSNTENDPRLIALNHNSICLFKELDIWHALTPHAAAIQQVHVSDRGHFGITRIHAKELRLDVLGYVVPACHINNVLNQIICAQSNIEVFRPATLKKLIQTDTHVSVTLETSTGTLELHGKQVIGADGSHSSVRQQLGIETNITDYQQSALVTITQLQRTHQHIAYERFERDGAIAILPLIGQRCATIWTQTKARILHLQNLSDTAFIAELQRHFGYRLGRLLTISKRYVFPLQRITTTQTHSQQVILLGNAAHTLHPIAAQGFNLALAEVAMLAECISKSPTKPQWNVYHDWQRQQQINSERLSHQLPWLFSQDFLPLTIARQIGMLGLDIFPTFKRRFARLAMNNTKKLANPSSFH